MGNRVKFELVYYLTHKEYGVASYRENLNTIHLLEFNDEYIKQVVPDPPIMICTQSQFFSDTLTLKTKGEYLKHGGVAIGIWEYYNEDGTLNHTENKDKHFPVTWEQLEEILKDKNISLIAVDSIFRYYDKEKDEATWSIIINLPLEKGHLYVFDARTGEIINEEIIDMRKEK